MNINVEDVSCLLWDKVSALKDNDKLWIGLAGVCIVMMENGNHVY